MALLGYLPKLILIAFWMGILPFILGNRLVIDKEMKARDIFLSYLYGWMKMMALFQVLALPLIFTYQSLSTLTIAWASGAIALMLYFLVNNRRKLKVYLIKKKRIPHINYIEWVAIVLILLQLVGVTFLTHEDADDSFFVSEAVTADYTDTMFQIQGETGAIYPQFPARYVMSPFPMFTAMISRLIMIHPAIVARTIFPLFFIPMSYLTFYLLGTELFIDDRKKTALCLCFLSILNVWGNVSVYTAASFLLFRIHQGKALLANLMLPFLIYLIVTSKKTGSLDVKEILITMTASTMVSSMGIFLAPVLLGTHTLVRLVKERRVVIIPQMLFCCLPNIALGIGFIIFKT